MMKEQKTLLLHETEWDLLDALWKLERATARQIAEELTDKRGWAYSTVKTLLDRMVTKGEWFLPGRLATCGNTHLR